MFCKLFFYSFIFFKPAMGLVISQLVSKRQASYIWFVDSHYKINVQKANTISFI